MGFIGSQVPGFIEKPVILVAPGKCTMCVIFTSVIRPAFPELILFR